jgi:hypothetical protein
MRRTATRSMFPCDDASRKSQSQKPLWSVIATLSSNR